MGAEEFLLEKGGCQIYAGDGRRWGWEGVCENTSILSRTEETKVISVYVLLRGILAPTLLGSGTSVGVADRGLPV